MAVVTNRPGCSHLAFAPPVQPRTKGCEECLAIGGQWAGRYGVADSYPDGFEIDYEILPTRKKIMDELKKVLNPTNVPEFEAVATTGVGVFDTLKAVAKLVLFDPRQIQLSQIATVWARQAPGSS